MFCSDSCRRAWHYYREKFLEEYTEEWRRRSQERWEWMVRHNGWERACAEAAPAIERVAEKIRRCELDMEPWKAKRRRAPRKPGRAA